MSIHNDRLARFCNHLVKNLEGYKNPAAGIMMTAVSVAIDVVDREDEEAGRLPKPIYSSRRLELGARKCIQVSGEVWRNATFIAWEEPNYAVFKLDTPLANGRWEVSISLPAGMRVREIDNEV